MTLTFKPAIWFPIAAILSAINVGAVWFAAVPAEPLHATTHAALAVAFGLWAMRLRQGPRRSELEEDYQQLELEANDLRQALAEAQERADFAERVLAQGGTVRRDDPKR